MNTSILVINYLEPYGRQIIDLCKLENVLHIQIENREPKGVGSLAQAINTGIKHIKSDYCWIVTNNTFSKNSAQILTGAIIETGCAAITPCFDNSDHLFQRPDGSQKVKVGIPYLEFTSPIVNTELLLENPLDESMPYWGHDLDWGHRMRMKGHKLGVHHGLEIKHIYIRDQLDYNEITRQRWELRKQSDGPTRNALIKKYGVNWRSKLMYK